ncbi:MAG: glycosyltransferase family 4 protein [Magnetococcales bacterium]|nr:glycosyltransferase family 4 protein [Magnetococcales bacterium]MBF0148649.1 glycosyltransferase family 4 protein [Magnetococcales bacterium]MBF0174083.1 glycosyltransferase family 4 protein [Magnetococcales bacterium]MBF0346851.1 glycosyltransferase family 4 protein [Magnetococcales bacterium]MBF0630890.1 glycosyltransferase family 4 protein [Magnetococcales bacterium]
MKIALVHNAYGRPSGEETVVAFQKAVLEEGGHEVVTFMRGSAEIQNLPFGRVRAFFSGIHNPFSRRKFRRFLEWEQPDIVHIHNLFPLISPAILPECGLHGVPVVMTVHNYRLVCPTGLHLHQGAICVRCRGGQPHQCFIHNCEGQWAKSLGYALRGMAADRLGYFKRHVHLFATLTGFQKQWLIEEGFDAARICVIPNAIDLPADPPPPTAGGGDYCAYVGRISKEKGIEVLLHAARRCPRVPFHLAGGFDKDSPLVRQVPENVRFLGHMTPASLVGFIRQARMVVLPSVWFEGFPMTVLEAMAQAKPVVASDVGGLGEIIDDGDNGWLFPMGDGEALAERITSLWQEPEHAARLGRKGWEKVRRVYSRERYFQGLMAAYHRVHPGGEREI